MTKCSRTHSVLPEDPSSVTSIHVNWFTTTCNCSSRGSGALPWPPWVLFSQAQSLCRCIIKNENKILRESNKRPSVDMVPIGHIFLLSFLREHLITTHTAIYFLHQTCCCLSRKVHIEARPSPEVTTLSILLATHERQSMLHQDFLYFMWTSDMAPFHKT